MNTQAVLKEKAEIKELSQEALEIIAILDQIENHTALLRKKLMEELKENRKALHLKLDNV